jgi:hypothetical protein
LVGVGDGLEDVRGTFVAEEALGLLRHSFHLVVLLVEALDLLCALLDLVCDSSNGVNVHDGELCVKAGR